MGIVNRTPDSFFDGGRHLEGTAAHALVDALVADGVDIIDVGAESTRPGSSSVSVAEQIRRLGETIPYAVSRGVAVSVDTTEPEVAAHATAQGATWINSVSLETAHELGSVAAAAGATLVLTHCRGSMTQMSDFGAYADDGYTDVVRDVAAEWNAAAALARDAGLADARIVFDPGLGFTKNATQSLRLVANIAPLRARVSGPGDTRRLILAGIGRKSYLARTVADTLDIAPPPPSERLGLTVAAAIDCADAGVDILRVHDVGAVRQALAYLGRIRSERNDGGGPPPPVAEEHAGV